MSSYRPFDSITDDVLKIVFSGLRSFRDLGRLFTVCKRFSNLLESSPILWKDICLEWWRVNGSPSWSLNTISEETGKDWRWIAECLSSGRPNGLSFNFGDSLGSRKIGEFKDRRLDGFGITARQESLWFGTYIDGAIQKGVQIFLNRERYEGNFNARAIPSGMGTYAFANGSRYEGQFEHGRRNGRGTFTFPNGSSLDVDWVTEVPNGSGLFIHPDGYTFSGMWKNGSPQGESF